MVLPGRVHLIIQSKRLRKKLTTAFFIICVYILGQNIPLPYVRIAEVGTDADQTFFAMLQAFNGANRQTVSIFALGIMPYMTASILMMLKNLGNRKNRSVPLISPELQVKLLALIMCVFVSALRTQNYQYTRALAGSYMLTRLFTVLVLVTGTFTIVWLTEQNAVHGIGGMTVVILVNIVKNIVSNLFSVRRGFAEGIYDPGKDLVKVGILFLIGFISMIVIMVFDDAELRIPVQKVMIYNEMADDNYMAVKLAPVGIQPMMYVMAFFTLPYYIFRLLAVLFPDVIILAVIARNLQMNTLPGVIIFFVIFLLLTLALAMVQISPEDIAEEMKKGGDCIIGLRPGDETEKYLKKIILSLSLISSVIMGGLVVLPMLLRVFWNLPQELAMLPMSLMFIGGILRRVSQQIRVLGMLDSYQEVL